MRTLLALPAVLALVGVAHAAPDAAPVDCSPAIKRFVALEQALPDAQRVGLKRLLAIVTGDTFPNDCAKLKPEQRACMAAAANVTAWMDCLKPPKPAVEAEPSAAGQCSEPQGAHGPVIVTAQEYADRAGQAAKRFSELPKEPIQECGIPASQQRLLALRCDDGSAPFATPDAVRLARKGNLGPGGRCKKMIDHYVAQCPEKAYDVHVDMYWCRPGAWPHY